jgi:hypothetical protein
MVLVTANLLPQHILILGYALAINVEDYIPMRIAHKAAL